MKITIISVGKIKERYLMEGIDEYVKRLSRFCDLKLIEVADEKAPETLSVLQEEQVKRKEAVRVLDKLKEGTYLVALDLMGNKMSSEGFADTLQSCFTDGKSNLTFVIGGSLGLDAGLVKKANLRLSLSDMTFPHQLTRLILLEQLFRAFKIMNGEPYHK